MIPLFSYMALGGKCRYCREKLSYIYPLIEFITAILFLLVYEKYGISLEFFKYTILFCFLIVISMIDINTKYVYPMITFTGVIISGVFLIIEWILYGKSPLYYILGMIISAAVIGLIVLITSAMGEGDIEIAALSGIFVGWQLSIFTIMLSFVLGSIIGSILIISKKKSKKDYIAFGPYIALATVVSVFYGQLIINYLNTCLYLNFV